MSGVVANIDVDSAGGVVALLVLPLAVALQRGVWRLVYGDRELPRSVVAELRGPYGGAQSLFKMTHFLF